MNRVGHTQRIVVDVLASNGQLAPAALVTAAAARMIPGRVDRRPWRAERALYGLVSQGRVEFHAGLVRLCTPPVAGPAPARPSGKVERVPPPVGADPDAVHVGVGRYQHWSADDVAAHDPRWLLWLVAQQWYQAQHAASYRDACRALAAYLAREARGDGGTA